MKKLSIGDVTIISIIERDGPWRTPQEMFPASYDPINGKRHLAELDPDSVSFCKKSARARKAEKI